MALADDCLVLEDGALVAQGPPLSVLSRPRAVGVAKLVGVDNLLHLMVLRHDEEGGVTLLDLGGGLELASPLCAAAVGEAVDVGLYAEDVILCLEPPEATSARNALPGTILATDRIGHEVLVTLRGSGKTERRGTSDDGGRVRFDLDPDRVVWTVEGLPSSTTGLARQFVWRPPALIEEPLVLVVARGGTLSGRVVDGQDRPVAGATVR